MTARVAFAALAFLYFHADAFGQEHEHHHPGKTFTGEIAKFYETWMRPDMPESSCCNKNDCDMTQAYFDRAKGVWKALSKVTGEWIEIPNGKIKCNREVPPGAHLCETAYGVLCFGVEGGSEHRMGWICVRCKAALSHDQARCTCASTYAGLPAMPSFAPHRDSGCALNTLCGNAACPRRFGFRL
jgi:hypothetical protein